MQPTQDRATQDRVRSLSGGVNQSGVRDFNERLLLSTLQRHGGTPGSELARRAGLSPQTVSVILRGLEQDGLLMRGEPQRGRVGKPSIPMTLAPDGAFSIGLKIGRRSAEMMLMDFCGTIRRQFHITYRYPMPAEVLAFLSDGLTKITSAMSARDVARISGIGVAAPFEMWKWHEALGAPAKEFAQWKEVDFAAEVRRYTDLPIYIENDATAACRAEHVFGRGREFIDYAYFFIGSFIGGGVVLNHSVYVGNHDNAGAFGSLRTVGRGGGDKQLIDTASIYLLESAIAEAGHDPKGLWVYPQDWSAYSDQLDPWIESSAAELAKAAMNACAVIDFEAILIDGAFPADVRRELVRRTARHIQALDLRGLVSPSIEEASVGGNARALGAACGPVFAQYFLNVNAGLSLA